jgi:uncharacterized phage protein (TIGR02220 family)
MIFYRSFWEAINTLPKEVGIEVYNSIFELAFNDKEVEVAGVGKGIMTLVAPHIKANNQRFANGKKAKRKQSGSKTEANGKQSRSKAEASDKQSGSKAEGNKDYNKDVNKDVDVNKEKIYMSFLDFLNGCVKRGYRGDAKSRRQFAARLGEGYRLEDFQKAAVAAAADPYHVETGHKHITPEFITRADKLEKFMNAAPQRPTPAERDDSW